MELIDRFVENVRVNENTGCWEWTRPLNRGGYGHIWTGKTDKLAHRISYELFVSPIPDDMLVFHHCKNRACVNPDHLFLGVASDVAKTRKVVIVPLLERFTKNVDKNGENGCWIWTAYKDPNGYGQMWADGNLHLTHRVSYKLFVGDIPDSMCVCHKCDNPSCVNPDHLFTGTMKDNSRDMIAKGRGRQPRYKGEKHWKAKLTWDKVNEIRSLYRSGNIFQREIAERFSIASSYVSKIILNRTWKDESL